MGSLLAAKGEGPLLGFLLACFLFGSIPFGILMARIFHGEDIRHAGSGNIGATNVSRVVGFWPAGLLTFLLDVGKGSLCCFMGTAGGTDFWTGVLRIQDASFPATLPWAAGLMAVFGHCFSPWLRFRGGKGVATGFGAILVLSPVAALAGLIAFTLVFLEKRIGSLSSLTGLLVATVTHLVLHPIGPQLWLGAILVAIILLRHETNIDALLENRENSFR